MVASKTEIDAALDLTKPLDDFLAEAIDDGTWADVLDVALQDRTDRPAVSVSQVAQRTGAVFGMTAQAFIREAWMRLQGQPIDVRHYGVTGDGTTDDTSAINTAISTLNTAGGGTLYFPPGTYIFTAIRLRSNVHLVGVEGSVLRLADNTTNINDNIAYYPITSTTGASNIMLRGLEFDGNMANNRPATIGSSWVADILTMIGDDFRVLDCYFRDAPDSGIMFATTKNCVVSGCRFDNCPDLGIYYSDTINGQQNNLIVDNRFTRCKHGAVGVKHTATALVIANNMIRDCGNGITVEDFGGGDHPHSVQIIGNRLEYIGYTYTAEPQVASIGISVNEAHGSIIANNLVFDSERYPFSFSGVKRSVITGNMVYGTANGDPAVAAYSFGPRNSTGCTHNVFANNVARNHHGAQGIHFTNMSAGTHEYNRVFGNDIQCVTGAGMRVEVNFAGNQVYGNTFEGLSTDFDLNINIASGNVANNMWADNVLLNGRINGFQGVETASYNARLAGHKHTEGTAAPTIGTWTRGDVVWQRNPAPGSPAGWVCTTSGTPGTWVAMADNGGVIHLPSGTMAGADTTAAQMLIGAPGLTGTESRGFTIRGGSTGACRISMGNSTSTTRGQLAYFNSDDSMAFATAGAFRWRTNSSALYPEADNGINLGSTARRFQQAHVGTLHLSVFTDATRPAAGTAGRVIFNSTDGNLNIDNGTNWVLPNGTVT